MASVIDICNLALSHVGEAACVSSIDPPDGSVAAALCAQFYALSRDNVLSLHDWAFATRRVKLAALATVPEGWRHAYALPTDFLRWVGLEAGQQVRREAPDARYSVESGVLLCEQPVSCLVYVGREEDATRYSSLCVSALGLYLASMLAGALIKGDAGASMSKLCLERMRVFLAEAQAVDARMCREPLGHVPMALRVRGAAPWLR